MTILAVTHVTVSVAAPLREAESHYVWLFGLKVAWREPVPTGAPFDLDWGSLDAAGVAPVISMMHSGEFRLAVTVAPESRPRGVFDHIGLQVDAGALAGIRERALAANAAVVTDREGELFDFIDRYGAEWELDTRDFSNSPAIVEQKRARMLAAAV